MKNLFLGLVAALILATGCHSNNSGTIGTAVNGADGPTMKFEKETHDFGKIKPGDIVTYDFKFTNTGKAPLIITDGYASCGCTKPTWPKTPVKPGETGAIHVVFDSKGKMGLQDKLITITANTNPADNHMHLIGDVEAN